MHRNMSFAAIYETTDEIIRELNTSPYEKDITIPIQDIFREADHVTFAKYIPSPNQSATLIERVLIPVRAVCDENRRKREDAARQAALSENNSGELPGDSNREPPRTIERSG